MKKLLLTVVAAALFAGVALSKDQYDIRPEATADKAQSSAEWQAANGKALEKATDPAVLAAFVKDASSAAALLAQVKPAYQTDPTVAFQIAAVTSWTMQEDPCFLFFWKESYSEGRKVWTDALLRAARSSVNAYRQMFFLDQLRWCAYAEQVPGIRDIGASSKDKCVREMCDLVVRELTGRRIGQ